MGFYIDDETLKKTTKCTCKFRCLSGMVHEMCKLGYNENTGKYICEGTGRKNTCVYRQPPSECTCPVRQQIFVSYGV